MKICFAASSGGHFEQLMMLKPLMEKYESFVVTEKTGYEVKTPVKCYYLQQVNRRRTGNAGHPCNGDRGQNRITESRDGKDHAECDENHGFFTNGLHGTKHTGIQTH